MKYCSFHKIVNHATYGEWAVWAEDQKKKGLKQERCKECGAYFYPEEIPHRPETK